VTTAAIVIGAVAVGSVAVGSVAVGSVAVGAVAVGAVAVGSVAVGAVAVGAVAVGAVAVGSVAVGSVAVGSVAVGAVAVGSVTADPVTVVVEVTGWLWRNAPFVGSSCGQAVLANRPAADISLSSTLGARATATWNTLVRATNTVSVTTNVFFIHCPEKAGSSCPKAHKGVLHPFWVKKKRRRESSLRLPHHLSKLCAHFDSR
jgi:hypothetical protein